MEMENNVYEEDILETESLIDDDTSSAESSSLEDQLDRIEALLNEDITLRESANENSEELQEDVEQGSNILSTDSGVSSDVPAPNYSQYIYDLLTDSSIKVEIVQQEDPTIFEKHLNDYTVTESILVIGLFCALSIIATHFIEKYVFKFRR